MGCTPIAVAKPMTPARQSICQRFREGLAHQTQISTVTPVVQIAPPNPARSWAIRGIRRALIDCRSDRARRIKIRSCGTKTRVMPNVMTVRPPAIMPPATARRSTRPIPKAESQLTRAVYTTEMDQNTITAPMTPDRARYSAPRVASFFRLNYQAPGIALRPRCPWESTGQRLRRGRPRRSGGNAGATRAPRPR